MPYSLPFLQIKMNGHFGSSGTVKTEYWSAGLHIAGTGGLAPGGSTILSFLTAIAPDVSTLHGSTSIKSGTFCFLDNLSGALIGTDGKYSGGSAQSTTIYNYPAAVAGSGTATGPFTQAMAWSLRSAILRGPGSHGRCFYPATALLVDATTGVLANSQQASYLTAVLTFINAVNVKAVTSFGASTWVSLVSPLAGGKQSPVTRVGIGARMDSMESREKSLSEAYVFANTTISTAVLEQAERDYLELLKSLPDFKDKD